MEKNCKYEEEELLGKRVPKPGDEYETEIWGDSGSGPCQRPYAGRYQAGKRRKMKDLYPG